MQTARLLSQNHTYKHAFFVYAGNRDGGKPSTCVGHLFRGKPGSDGQQAADDRHTTVVRFSGVRRGDHAVQFVSRVTRRSGA